MLPSATSQSVRDAIYGRHSVRTYAPDGLDESTVATLLAAAVQAPTAIHQEPWQFVIVQDKARLHRLSERAKTLFAPEAEKLHTSHGHSTTNPFAQTEFDVFYGAGALIIICANPALPFVDADCWMAAENLMLMAQSMGLGTCVIGSAVKAINEPAFRSELGIPADSIAIAPIIVGKPGQVTAKSPRKAPFIMARR